MQHCFINGNRVGMQWQGVEVFCNTCGWPIFRGMSLPCLPFRIAHTMPRDGFFFPRHVSATHRLSFLDAHGIFPCIVLGFIVLCSWDSNVVWTPASPGRSSPVETRLRSQSDPTVEREAFGFEPPRDGVSRGSNRRDRSRVGCLTWHPLLDGYGMSEKIRPSHLVRIRP